MSSELRYNEDNIARNAVILTENGKLINAPVCDIALLEGELDWKNKNIEEKKQVTKSSHAVDN